MKQTIRRVALISAMAMSAAGIGAQAISRVGIVDTLGSVETGARSPARFAADGDANSAWMLAEGRSSGWIELGLARAVQISGMEIDGRLEGRLSLAVEYREAGTWKPFAGGFPAAATSPNLRLDLSYEGAISDRLRIRLSGLDADTGSIAEVRILAQEPGEIFRLLAPDTIEASERTNPLFPAENLFDGNPKTNWTAASGGPTPWDGPSGWPRDVERKLEERLPSRGKLRDGMRDSRVQASFDVAQRVELVRVYLSDRRSEDIYLLAKGLDGKWRNIERISSRAGAGWQEFALGGEAILGIGIECEGSWNRARGGIGELEIWGFGLSAEASYSGIDGVASAEAGSESNLSFTIESPFGLSIEYATRGGATADSSVELNGRSYQARMAAQFADEELWSFDVPASELWPGGNYLRIPARSGQSLLLARYRQAAPTGKLSPREGGGLFDGNLLDSAEEMEAERVFEFGRKVKFLRLEAFGEGLAAPRLSVPKGQGWEVLSPSEWSSGRYRFDNSGEYDRLKVDGRGAGLAELKILGSETREKAPEIEFLSPEMRSGMLRGMEREDYVIGRCDDGEATVKINGKRVETQDGYFWFPASFLSYTPDEAILVSAEAKDQKGRTGRAETWLVIGDTRLMELDQADEVIHSSEPSITLSGSVKASSYLVRIDGRDATMNGKRFSGKANLREGLNLVAVTLVHRPTGKALQTVFRKVVLSSAPMRIEIDSPSPGGTERGPTIAVRGRAYGAGTITVTVNGLPASVSGSQFAREELPLVEGVNDIRVEARDFLGRTTQKIVSLNRDSTPPAIVLEAPLEGSFLADSLVEIEGSLLDASACWVYAQGRLLELVDGAFRSYLPYQEGPAELLLEAVDAAGNRTERKIGFTVDTIPPLSFQTQVLPGSWTSDTRPVLSFSTSDATSGIARYEIQVGEGNWIVAASPYKLPSQSDGERTVRVAAVDRAGNTRMAETRIYIDTTAPEAVGLFRAIPGSASIRLLGEAPSEDTRSYELERSPAFPEGLLSLALPDYEDSAVEPGVQYSYRMRAVDRAENRGPFAAAETRAAIAQAPYESEEGAVVLHERASLLIPPEALPPEVERIEVTEVISEDLVTMAENPIIGPMLSFGAVTSEGGEETSHANVSFETSYLVRMSYDEAALPENYPETALGVFYYDENWGRWMRVAGSAVDAERNEIYFATDHFTDFSVQATPVKDLGIDEFRDPPYSPFGTATRHDETQVSPQGGSLSTGMTELVLPGPRGFDLALKRVYDTGTARRDARNYSYAAEQRGALDAQAYRDLIVNIRNKSLDEKDAEVKKRIEEARSRDGDYAYSMGQGWRLDLPFIRETEDDYFLRAPAGGSYSVATGFPAPTVSSSGDYRTLRFELHEGEDFVLEANQQRTTHEKWFLFIRTQSEAWSLTGWKLTEKDGRSYDFDDRGRLKAIHDPTGTFSITLAYADKLLSTITDARGRILQFGYEEGFGRPYISSIAVKDEPRYPDAISYTRDPGTDQLITATDLGGRSYSYVYAPELFLLSGNMQTELSSELLVSSFGSQISGSAGTFAPKRITLLGDTQYEWLSLLETASGPGIGSTKAGYSVQALGFDPATGKLLDKVPGTGTTVFNLSFRIPAVSLERRESLGGPLVMTRTMNYEFGGPDAKRQIAIKSTVDDGRSLVSYGYEAIQKTRTRTVGDFEKKKPLSGGGSTEQDIVPLLTSIETRAKADQRLLSTTKRTYDEATLRMKSQTETRGAALTKSTSYSYDGWGNEALVTVTETAGGITRILNTQTEHANGGTQPSFPTAWKGDIPTPNPIPATIHDLPYRRIVSGSGTEKAAAAPPRESYWRYDSKGRLSNSAVYDGVKWLETSLSYDEAWGEVSKVTAPDSHVTEFEYNKSLSPFLLEKRTEKNVVDAEGNKADIVTSRGIELGSGLVIWERDGLGYVTTYEYDSLGRALSLEKPSLGEGRAWNPLAGGNLVERKGNPRITVSYDDVNLTATAIDPVEAQTVYDFDGLGRLREIRKSLRPLDAEGLPTTGTLTLITTKASYNAWGEIISLLDPLNHETLFEYDAIGRPTATIHPTQERRSTSYLDDDAQRVLIDEEDGIVRESLDWAGRVTRRERAVGMRSIVERFEYDAFGLERVRYVDEWDGRTARIDTSYDPRGNKIAESLPEENFFENGELIKAIPKLDYGYDSAGRLTLESAEGPGFTRKSIHVYDGLGRRIRTSVPYRAEVEGVSTEKTAVTSYGYDQAGRVVAETDPEGRRTERSYGARGELLEERKPGGGLTRYAYDAADRPRLMTDPRGSSLGDPEFSIEYRYDDLGRLALGILPGEDRRPRVQLKYDPRGQLLERQDPEGGLTRYQYDERNRLVKETASGLTPEGAERSYAVRHGYDGLGREVWTEDALGYRSTAEYDQAGRLLVSRSPEGRETRSEYDARGNQTALIDGRGIRSEISYDLYGRPTKSRDGAGKESIRRYDRLGRLTESEDAKGRKTRYLYNQLDQLLAELRPDGSERRYEYDSLGHLLASVDGRGTVSDYEYDEDYNLLSLVRKNGDRTEILENRYDLSGALMQSEEGGILLAYNREDGAYRPDPYGRVRSAERELDGRKLSLGYAYDDMGRVNAVRYPSGREASYRYDGTGRLFDLEGYLTEIEYDGTGRFLGMSFTNGVRLSTKLDRDGKPLTLGYSGLETLPAFDYGYDGAGNLVRKNQSSYGYDLVNRLILADESGRFKTDSKEGQKAILIGEGDYRGQAELSYSAAEAELALDRLSTSIGVDLGSERELSAITIRPRAASHRMGEGRLELLVSASGAADSWTRLTDYSLEKETTGALLLRLRKPVPARFVKLHSFHDDRAADGQGIDLATARNEAGELIRVEYYETRRITDYGYDEVGNRSRETEYFAGRVEDRAYEYYPNSDLLKSDGIWAYAYDGNGNLSEKGRSFSENGEGRLSFSASEGEYWKYEYDLANRMTRVLRGEAGKQSATERASYRYDPTGLKISKTVAGKTSYYVYGIEGNELAEIGEEGSLETIWALGKKIAEIEIPGSAFAETNFLATDHLGSVVAVTDSAGRLLWSGEQGAFGDAAAGTGLKKRLASYTGKDWDEEAGLYYFNARWYDSSLGRFTTEDPVKDGGNWYAYVSSRPLTFTDPWGLVEIEGAYSADNAEDKEMAEGAEIARKKEREIESEERRQKAQVTANGSLAQPPSITSVLSNSGLVISPGSGLGSQSQLFVPSPWNLDFGSDYYNSIFSAPNLLTGIQYGLSGLQETALDAGLAYLGAYLVGALEGLPSLMGQAGATQAAGKGAELTSSQLKSIQSYENLIAEHGQKLAQYIKDPYAFDNKGFLKNAPTPEIAQKIIDARIRGLQQEIQTFQENIQKILGD